MTEGGMARECNIVKARTVHLRSTHKILRTFVVNQTLCMCLLLFVFRFASVKFFSFSHFSLFSRAFR